ncbi:hypothetical protein GCM10023330_07850 [Litoribaculum gwangyangense]|uniref:Uncharacterized protein n=1 Tax=Litoribaculum gwangyangense TaxID=1130722 RepID=A0ABP9C2F1_9FLAO
MDTITIPPVTNPAMASYVWYPSSNPLINGASKIDEFISLTGEKTPTKIIASRIKTIIGVKYLPRRFRT